MMVPVVPVPTKRANAPIPDQPMNQEIGIMVPNMNIPPRIGPIAMTPSAPASTNYSENGFHHFIPLIIAEIASPSCSPSFSTALK